MSSERPSVFISVVSPVYRAEHILDLLVKRISEEVSLITNTYEIILVEDASPDNSWEVIKKICANNTNVKGIKFSRNFGQHYAITAGLEAAKGDFVVVMDCDLQDNPKYIKELYEKCKQGAEIVFTKKQKREHSLFKNIAAKIYFTIFNYLSNNQVATDDVGSFSMLSKKVVKEFCRIKDTHRHYLMVLRLLGFKTAFVEIIHEKRAAGKSSYTFLKLAKHAIDGITSQSDKLLRISISIGFAFFLIAILWSIVLVVNYYRHGAFPGYTSLMAIILLSVGLILMSIGITGIYIGKIFEQVKDRPLYIVEEKINI